MSLFDLFHVKDMRSTISALAQENESLKKQNEALETQIFTLKSNIDSQNELLKKNEDSIHSLLPLFDIKRFDIPEIHMHHKKLWSLWDSQIHADDMQIVRQQRACAAIYTPISLFPMNTCGVFYGSEHTYNTYLTHCDCVDFQRRALPCKHMYRLAHEFDVFALDHVEFHPDIQHALRHNDLWRIRRSLNNTQNEIIDIAFSDDVVYISPAALAPLAKCRILEELPDNTLLLENFTRDELLDFIQKNTTDKISKNSKKSVLIDTIITSYPDIIAKIRMIKVPAGPSIYIKHLL